MMLVHITKRTQDMAQAKLASSVTKHERLGRAIVCLFIRHSMSMARAVRCGRREPGLRKRGRHGGAWRSQAVAGGRSGAAPAVLPHQATGRPWIYFFFSRVGELVPGPGEPFSKFRFGHYTRKGQPGVATEPDSRADFRGRP